MPDKGGDDREPGPPVDPAGDRGTRGVQQRFGSAGEAITGVGVVIARHEDRAARVWLGSSIFWFIIVTSFGLIAATELTVPETFAGISWLVFSRIRPCHVEGVIFAWLTMMYFGAIFYWSPRLLGTSRMWSERLAIWCAWCYNVAMAAGFWGILSGHTQGREYAEFPWLIDAVILSVFALNAVNIVGTVGMRTVRPLYVSIWWAVAAPMWVWGSIFIENVFWRPGNVWGSPSGNLPTGLHDALINWWGNHNLFGLWLTPVLVATVYYFIPRITNTPLYSHTLSLVSFWGFIFVYAGVGDHHLLQTPTPGWLKTIASVNSVGILIPVFAFFSNVFLTMRGQWDRFYTSLPLRFIITGWFFYILVNIQGASMAVQPLNHIIHFSYYTIGHSHLALLGAFTILGQGVIYYMFPHVFAKRPYSRALAEWQYWLITIGFLTYFVSMTIAGFIQGQSWLISINEVMVLPKLRLWNMVRAVGGGMVYASAWIQAYNILKTRFVDTGEVGSKLAREDSRSALEGEHMRQRV